MNAFSNLNVSDAASENLSKRGISVPTEVQKQVIPPVYEGKNVIFQSETGTGKTLAYLLPLMTKAFEAQYSTQGVRIIVLSPTHELSSQIRKEAEQISQDIGADMKTALFIGGSPIKRQIEKLKEKPEIVCGAPSRILELISLRKLKTDTVGAVVLDEADRLLSPEMRDETLRLLGTLPPDIQYVACSATIRKNITQLLSSVRRDSSSQGERRTFTEILLPPEDVLKRRITHWALFAEQRDKIDYLMSLIRAEKPGKALIFVSSPAQVQNIAARLQYKKIPCSTLSAQTEKVQRKKALDDFRSGKCAILVTSDLAARGLDIENVTHIVQMDLPENEEFFVHRAGRTARAGKQGINVVIGDERELRRLALFENKLKIIIYPKILAYGRVNSPDQITETEKE